MSENDIAILEDLAAVAQREIITMQLAMLDELTGLSNRRGFISRAESSLSLAKRENIKVSLAFIDLDKFKMINDNFGHKKGDEALVVFSRLVKSVCRSSDLIARIGGDEFVVLFMGSDKESAEKKLKNLAEKIMEVNSNSPYKILFSHGVVECDLQNKISISALLDESDKLMYVDKNQKRKD
jgi:diguanylate cyclase (GGDEF)-like protein